MELAKNEIKEEYNSVSVFYDAEAQMYMVLFYNDNMTGGVSVYLTADGITTFIVPGE